MNDIESLIPSLWDILVKIGKNHSINVSKKDEELMVNILKGKKRKLFSSINPIELIDAIQDYFGLSS